MIAYLNPLQGEEFLDLCCVEPIIGARICSWYCCYANAYPFCDLWIIYSDRKNPDFPPSETHEGYPHGVAARYQGTLCIACDLDVDFDELAEFIAGSGAMEVECLSPIMDELLPRIPYRLRQRQTVMTYDFDREGQPGFPPAAVLSERNFIYSDHLDSDADAFVENRELREMYEVICQAFRIYGFYPETLFFAQRSATTLEMVSAGICCSVVPSYFAASSHSHVFEHVSYFSFPSHPVWNICASRKKGSYLSAAADCFIRLSQEYWGELIL